MEHGSVGDVLLSPVTFGDVYHANWRFFEALHFSNLTIRSVGSEDHASKIGIGVGVVCFDEKCFLFVAGRMANWHVERFKDVFVPVHFGVADASEADGGKDPSDFVDGLGNRVKMADGRKASWFSKINNNSISGECFGAG